MHGAMTMSCFPVPLHVTHFLIDMTLGTGLQGFEVFYIFSAK